MSHALTPAPEQFGSGPEPDANASSHQTGRRTAGRTIVVAAVAAVLVGGGGYFLGYQSATSEAEEATSIASAVDAARSDARLTQAFESCERQDSGDTMELTDGGQTIVVDTGSEYGSVAGMDCVMSELGTPQSTLAAIGRTTSMMGVQDDEDDGISYSWSYHPDNGVNMLITLDD